MIHSGSLHLGERQGPARRRELPPPIRPGSLHPTRQGPNPSASPWWASRPRHVSFRGIMPPRGRGPGLDMSVWISPPTPRNADAVRDVCRLHHSDLHPRPGRSSRGRGPSPGTPLSGAAGVGRDDGPRPRDLSFRLTLTHKRLQGSSEPCIKSSVLEGFVAKRSSPPSDPKAPDAQVDDYDPADHVEDIPAEGLEFSPDFNAQTSTRSNWPL